MIKCVECLFRSKNTPTTYLPVSRALDTLSARVIMSYTIQSPTITVHFVSVFSQFDPSASSRMHHISGGVEKEGSHDVDIELRDKFHMYETGKRGHLLSIYNNIIKHWLHFCCRKLGMREEFPFITIVYNRICCWSPSQTYRRKCGDSHF